MTNTAILWNKWNELAIISESHFPKGRRSVPHARPGLAVVTQAAIGNDGQLVFDRIDDFLRGRGDPTDANLRALASGIAAPNSTQFAFIALTKPGNYGGGVRMGAYSGPHCIPHAGRRTCSTEDGDAIVAIGNHLAGPEVLDAMVETWKDAPACGIKELALQVALAGSKAGGERGADRRGANSATLVMLRRNSFERWDVDRTPHPLQKLREMSKHEGLSGFLRYGQPLPYEPGDPDPELYAIDHALGIFAYYNEKGDPKRARTALELALKYMNQNGDSDHNTFLPDHARLISMQYWDIGDFDNARRFGEILLEFGETWRSLAEDISHIGDDPRFPLDKTDQRTRDYHKWLLPILNQEREVGRQRNPSVIASDLGIALDGSL
jgi:uncharacterized Ntn-hydrolase superfamily protein